MLKLYPAVKKHLGTYVVLELKNRPIRELYIYIGFSIPIGCKYKSKSLLTVGLSS